MLLDVDVWILGDRISDSVPNIVLIGLARDTRSRSATSAFAGSRAYRVRCHAERATVAGVECDLPRSSAHQSNPPHVFVLALPHLHLFFHYRTIRPYLYRLCRHGTLLGRRANPATLSKPKSRCREPRVFRVTPHPRRDRR